MGLREFLQELHRRNVFKVAVAYIATGAVMLEVLTHLFHNFEAPHWVLKVITTLLIAGLPAACLMAWGFEFKEGGVRSVQGSAVPGAAEADGAGGGRGNYGGRPVSPPRNVLVWNARTRGERLHGLLRDL